MEAPKSTYALYYNPYSICSLMVLYTWALRGELAGGEEDINMEKRLVDIFHEEQMTEHFLCEINDHGQVPVLTNSANLDAPIIADSLKITYFLASRYTSLMPSEKEEEIRRYLVDLHALNYFSLSFPRHPEIAQGFEATIKRLLGDSTISDRYREALEFKLGIVQRDKTGGLVPTETAKNEALARKLLASLEGMLDSPNGWLYGTEPTALDAHLIVFIARMTDVGRDNLISQKLKDYGAWAMHGNEWTAMMGGRKTMAPK